MINIKETKTKIPEPLTDEKTISPLDALKNRAFKVTRRKDHKEHIILYSTIEVSNSMRQIIDNDDKAYTILSIEAMDTPIVLHSGDISKFIVYCLEHDRK